MGRKGEHYWIWESVPHRNVLPREDGVTRNISAARPVQLVFTLSLQAYQCYFHLAVLCFSFFMSLYLESEGHISCKDVALHPPSDDHCIRMNRLLLYFPDNDSNTAPNLRVLVDMEHRFPASALWFFFQFEIQLYQVCKVTWGCKCISPSGAKTVALTFKISVFHSNLWFQVSRWEKLFR